MTPVRQQWVLLMTDVFGAVGGIPTFNQEFLRAFSDIARERGWTLRVLALHDPAGPSASTTEYEFQGFSGSRWRFIREALQASRKADHVLFGHVHFSPLALVMPRTSRWLVAHGIEVWDSLGWLRRLGLGRMDRILSVSEFTRHRLIERHHVKAERISVFPNTRRVVPSEPKGNVSLLPPGASHLIFTVSRLWPQERYKKIDRVIEAMPLVLKAIPGARYAITGEGADRPRLERVARDLGVQNAVEFTGALSDDRLRAYYEACDVFILPSLGEGFGIVFLEAMACGKACIGDSAGAIPEVIQDGRTGLLVKPDSSQAIAESLIRLLQDAPLRHSMGRAGRERFVANYAVDRFRERLAALTESA